MKKLLPLLFIGVGFLFVFNFYRFANGSEQLYFENALQYLKDFNYDFDNLSHYVSLLVEDWQDMVNAFNEPLPNIGGADIFEFFRSFGTWFQELSLKLVSFFNMIGQAIMVLFGFLFDFIEMFVEFIKLLFNLLGLNIVTE